MTGSKAVKTRLVAGLFSIEVNKRFAWQPYKLFGMLFNIVLYE